jgi:hypothetical protein
MAVKSVKQTRCKPGAATGARKSPTPTLKTPSMSAVGITKPNLPPIRQGARRPASFSGSISTVLPARSVAPQPIPADIQLRKLIVEKLVRARPVAFCNVVQDNWDEGYINEYYHTKQREALDSLFAAIIIINTVNAIPIPVATHHMFGLEKQKIIDIRGMYYEAIATARWRFRRAYELYDSAIDARYCITTRFHEGTLDRPHQIAISMLQAEQDNIMCYIDYLDNYRDILHDPFAAKPQLQPFKFRDSRIATENAGVVMPEKCANSICRPAMAAMCTPAMASIRGGS